MAVIKIGSVTRASRAKEILAKAGISASVRKLGNQKDGCVHALEVDPRKLEQAQRALESSGIRGTVII